jgi:hypothetical protein
LGQKTYLREDLSLRGLAVVVVNDFPKHVATPNLTDSGGCDDIDSAPTTKKMCEAWILEGKTTTRADLYG